jgi:hypothetical protein
LPALAYLTGDMSLVADELRPVSSGPAVVLAPQGGMTEQQQSLARRRALGALGTDLRGKRVGVIGSGASGYQVVPSVVDEVGELRLFLRNPPWTVPTPNYHAALKPGLAWLFKAVPYYHRWFRFYQFWTSVEGRRDFAAVDPDWHEPGAVSAKNQRLRETLTRHLMAECAVHYVLDCLRLLLERGDAAMDLRPEVLGSYQVAVDEANAAMAWGVEGVSNWYKSASGRVSQNWPPATIEYWDLTRRADPGHYQFELLT